MTTRTLLAVCSAIEGAVGLSLIVGPGMVARILLRTELFGGGMAVGRLAGAALLALGLACWPSENHAAGQSTRALLIYNFLAAAYLAYLGLGEGFFSYLLWPVCVLHALLALLLARPALASFSAARVAERGK